MTTLDQSVPPELWVTIACKMDPIDVLHLTETCSTLHEALSSNKSLWCTLLRNMCADNGLFSPSFAYDSEMSLRDLRRAVFRPARFKRVLEQHAAQNAGGGGGDLEPISYSTSDAIQVSSDLWQKSVDQNRILVPGGRFFINACDESAGDGLTEVTVDLWDLGAPGRLSVTDAVSEHTLVDRKVLTLQLEEGKVRSSAITVYDDRVHVAVWVLSYKSYSSIMSVLTIALDDGGCIGFQQNVHYLRAEDTLCLQNLVFCGHQLIVQDHGSVILWDFLRGTAFTMGIVQEYYPETHGDPMHCDIALVENWVIVLSDTGTRCYRIPHREERTEATGPVWDTQRTRWGTPTPTLHLPPVWFDRRPKTSDDESWFILPRSQSFPFTFEVLTGRFGGAIESTSYRYTLHAPSTSSDVPTLSQDSESSFWLPCTLNLRIKSADSVGGWGFLDLQQYLESPDGGMHEQELGYILCTDKNACVASTEGSHYGQSLMSAVGGPVRPKVKKLACPATGRFVQYLPTDESSSEVLYLVDYLD